MFIFQKGYNLFSLLNIKKAAYDDVHRIQSLVFDIEKYPVTCILSVCFLIHIQSSKMVIKPNLKVIIWQYECQLYMYRMVIFYDLGNQVLS
jgi:hypothetical protein